MEEVKTDSGLKQIIESARTAREIYLTRRPVSVAFPEIDAILDGGLEAGNFYLFLGAAKSGKTTTLRSLAIRAARTGYPVLYVNFEQPGENSLAKIYNMLNRSNFQRDIVYSPEETARRIESFEQDLQVGAKKLERLPFWIAFWPKDLDPVAFNITIKQKLSESIAEIREKDPEKRKPLVILENLSDIYNERVNGRDSLTNIVTQTAQDIKRFAMSEDVAILLAHHSGKIRGEEPTLDDVRDSKRVVDLAHSIFTTYVEDYEDALGFQQFRRVLKYMGGRGMSDPRRWIVRLDGVDVELEDYTEPPKKSNSKRKVVASEGVQV